MENDPQGIRHPLQQTAQPCSWLRLPVAEAKSKSDAVVVPGWYAPQMWTTRAAVLTVMLTCSSPATAKPSSQASSRPAVALQQTARRLVKTTARLRGLRRRRRVKMGVMSRAQILSRIELRMRQDYTDEELRTDGAVLKRLGLLPATSDYRAEVLKLLADQVAGFYDPHDRQLKIAAWLSVEMQTPALVHEICHALQDQHFRLGRFVRPIKDNSDARLARAAIVEGDCTGVMIEHLLAPFGRDLSSIGPQMNKLVRHLVSGRGNSAAFKAAPPFLRRTLTFPYVAGLRFVQRVRQRHPWKLVNRLFRRPPRSTEQVIHYDKYWANERPVRVVPRSLRAIGKSHRLIKQDTLGELQLRLWLEPVVGQRVAARAAAGWGGDRMQAYRPTDSADPRALPGLILATAWDSEADAIELVNAARRLLAARTVAALPSSQANEWRYRDAEKQTWAIARRRAKVVLLLAWPDAAVTPLLAEVWKRFRFYGPRPL